MSDNLAADIQRILDLEAIRQLKAKQVRTVDAKEWDTWRNECLHPDFEMHGDGGLTAGRDNVVASVSSKLAEATTVHRLHNSEVTITGPDSATAIWPVDDYVTMTHQGQPMVIRGFGHYHDDYIRTPDGWRIRRTKLIRQKVDRQMGEPAK